MHESKEEKKEVKKKQVIKIEVVSDNVWPWCFVGKRRMEKAISTLNPKEVEVKVTWQPFELNSGLPEKSIEKLKHYQKKFGTEGLQSKFDSMIKVGEEEGIAFSYGGRIGNTMKSHRLIEFALQKDSSLQLQDKLIELIFSAYFEQEKDIANNDCLSELAHSAGVFESTQEAKDFLESDEMMSEVRSKFLSNQNEGIDGVPFFKIDNKYAFSGAQKAATFLEVFRKLGVKC